MRILAAVAIAFVGLMMLVPNRPAGAQVPSAETTYVQKCATCHGADGSGNTAIGKKMSLRDLTSQEVQAQTDDELFKIIAEGKGKMPAYLKPLGEDGVRAQVAYLRELASKHAK